MAFRTRDSRNLHHFGEYAFREILGGRRAPTENRRNLIILIILRPSLSFAREILRFSHINQRPFDGPLTLAGGRSPRNVRKYRRCTHVRAATLHDRLYADCPTPGVPRFKCVRVFLVEYDFPREFIRCFYNDIINNIDCQRRATVEFDFVCVPRENV